MQLKQTCACLYAIRARESARSAPYQVVARARIDALWFGPLASRAWDAAQRGETVVPSQQAWRGVNDRFMLGPRAAFEAYASLYDHLLAGSGAWAGGALEPMNSEMAFAKQLAHARVTLARNSQLLPYCHVALGSTATTASCPVCRTGAEGVVAQVLSREQRALARQACGLPLKAWSQGLVPCKAPSPVREGVCSTTV